MIEGGYIINNSASPVWAFPKYVDSIEMLFP